MGIGQWTFKRKMQLVGYGLENLNFITIYAPVNLMAPGIMVFMQVSPLQGVFQGPTPRVFDLAA